ncbi:MAG: hypothetical protein HQL09_10490 [Nitrospirae bacterium]|nr:hypothetical protein [Nitrospirota bacterium]
MIIPDVLYDRQCCGLAMLQLDSSSVYIINDHDLDTADLILLFFGAAEC